MLLLDALAYGWYCVQRVLRRKWTTDPSLPIAPTAAQTGSALRFIVPVLYALGAAMLLAAIPLFVIMARGDMGHLLSKIAIVLVAAGTCDLTAALLLLRGVQAGLSPPSTASSRR